MTRVVMIAIGVPRFLAAPKHGGPGLRAAHLATALARAGHDVLLVAVVADDELARLARPARRVELASDADAPSGSIVVEFTTEKLLPGEPMRRCIDAFGAAAVVGVTVYAAALAARLRLGLPMWADCFGDLMAEAQAKAARTGGDWSLVHFWTLMRGVLDAADRFSAVSVVQSHALVGQLGLAGRLSSLTAGEDLVSVIPCAAEPTGAPVDRVRARLELDIDEDDLVLLLSGGVNTWSDVETIVDGLRLAIEREPRVRVLLTGGAVDGHDESSFPSLVAGLRAIDAANASDRIRVLGWIESAKLPDVYAAADLALHIERPLYERMLGAENRVVEWLAHGLPVVTTALSETGRRLVTDGIAFACRPGDAADLARVIGQLATRPELLDEVSRRGRRWAFEERDYTSTAAPLVRWCASPQRAGDQAAPRLVRLGLLSHPETSVDFLEAYVASLPLREVVRRGVRWVARGAVRWLAGRSRNASSALGRSVAGAAPGARAATSPSPQDLPPLSPQEAPPPLPQEAPSPLPQEAPPPSPPPQHAPPPTSLAAVRRFQRHAVPMIAMLLLFALAMLTAGCEPAAKSKRGRRPNILLLSVDTLRADHLGAYGYLAKPSPTPSLDALARRGVLFEQAITSAPETAPALATLVTGVYQDRHGVLYNRARLAEDRRTIAERLKEAGYDTAAFLANWLVDPSHGFGQGFDQVEMMPGGEADSKSADDKLVAAFGGFLRRREEGDGAAASAPAANDTRSHAPWFVWVHMMDPHGPYNSAPAWWSRPFDYANAPLARDGEFPISDSSFGLGVIPHYQKLEGAKLLSDYVRRYDGEIRFTDTQIGSILALLAQAGEADDTLVVVTADHGESLVEHDEFLQHGWFVYDTTVRVPLIVAWPGGVAAGKRVAGEVCMIDIVPTLLEIAGVAAPADELDGRSLAAELGAGGARAAGETAGHHDAAETAAVHDAAGTATVRDAGCFAVGPRANHPIALRRGRYKAIVTPAGAPTDPRASKGTRSDEPERIELYDLQADPAETANVAAAHRDVTQDMTAQIASLRARFRASGWRW